MWIRSLDVVEIEEINRLSMLKKKDWRRKRIFLDFFSSSFNHYFLTTIFQSETSSRMEGKSEEERKEYTPVTSSRFNVHCANNH